jgi:hypothetical protein
MAVTRSPRFRLHRWDSGADPFNRAQNDTDNLQVETLGAVFRQGPSADIGDPTAAAYARSFFFDTTVSVLYFSDGTNWVSLNDAGETGDIEALTIGGSSSAGSVSAPASGIKTVEFALANHVHALPAAGTPSDTGTANLAGSALTLARSDHVHAIGLGSINSSSDFAASVVDTAALGSSAVTTAKIADSNVTTAKVADSAITTAKVNDGAITGPKLAASVAGSGLIRNVSTSVLDVSTDGVTVTVTGDAVAIVAGGIGTTQLADGGVTTAKVANSAITTVKVADANITGPKLASTVAGSGLTQNVSGNLDVNVDGSTLAITTDALGIAAGGVGATQLASNAVTAAKIASSALSASGAITGGAGTALAVSVDGSTLEIATNALRLKDLGITTAKLGNLQVTGAKIAAATITADKFAPGAVSGASLDDGAVITQKIANLAVTTAKIADGAVTAAKIATGALSSSALADGAIVGSKLNSAVAGSGLVQNVSGNIDVNADATLAVTTDALGIATGGVGATQLASNAVTTAKITDANVTTAKLADASVTAAKLASSTAGAGLSQNGTSKALDVQVDNSTVEISTNTLRVKDSGIVTAKIATDAVTTAKILNANVTTAKIADSAVTSAKLDSTVAGDGLAYSSTTGLAVNVGGPLSIVTDTVTVAAGAIGASFLGADSVTTAKILNGNVTTAKIADGAVTPLKIDSTIVGAGLTRNAGTGVITPTVDGSTIAVNGSSQLAVVAGGIGTTQLAASAVTGSKSGAGVYRNATNADTGGSIRYSTSAPSGTAANGDIWLRYS